MTGSLSVCSTPITANPSSSSMLCLQASKNLLESEKKGREAVAILYAQSCLSSHKCVQSSDAGMY